VRIQTWISLWSIVVFGVVGAGCRGTIDDPGGDPGNPSDPSDPSSPLDPTDRGRECDPSELAVSDTPLRRLSHTELRFTLRDLFDGVGLPELELIDDPRIYGFENNAGALAPNSVLIEQYDRIGFEVASAVVSADREARARALGCWPDGGDATAERDCGHVIVEDFGRRAFRRPLTTDELGRYQDFFDAQYASHGFEVATRLLLQAMLQAPQLLYRLEHGDPATSDGELVALNDYEIATRLSYFLWASTPDEELLSAAAAGMLSDDAQLEVQVRRMLDDPRARPAVVDFHRQWLDFDRVEGIAKDSELYPSYDADLNAAMRDEVDLFVEHAVFDGAGTLDALLLDRTAFVDPSLAELYGVEPPSGEGWEMRELPEGERAGLLTRAAFLASHAHLETGSPPLRGVFVLKRILCNDVGAPPPNADTSAIVLDDSQTNREAFEARTEPATCQGCHRQINGLGYGFETFDAIGAYRTIDNGQPVDASGWILSTDVDGEYDGPVELSERLSESKQVEWCAALNWFRYANGREETSADACVVDELAEAFTASGGDIRELMAAIATRPEFRYRRVTH
jgi:hypothetical protein